MSTPKSTTHSILKPELAGRPQSQLDWNTCRKPTVTPRREYSFMRNYAHLPATPAGSGFGPANSGVIQ